MQDSYQLPEDDNNYQLQQSNNNNNNNPTTTSIPTNNNTQLLLTSITSPKNNRRLVHSYNTASQQSLAYSNSTYHNKLTQRSPPLFNLDCLNYNNYNNDQNVNTMNYSLGNNYQKIVKNEMISTFGAYSNNIGSNSNINTKKGIAIKFDRITQQSGIQSQGNSFFNNNNNNKSSNGIEMIMNDMSQQLIQLPCFLSLQNSPQNVKMTYNNNNIKNNNQNNGMDNSRYNKQLEQVQIVDIREVLEKDSLTIPMKRANNYKKINPSIMMINNHNNQQIDDREITTRRQFLNNNNKYDKYEKTKIQKNNKNHNIYQDQNSRRQQNSYINQSKDNQKNQPKTNKRLKQSQQIIINKQTRVKNIQLRQKQKQKNNKSSSPLSSSKSPSPSKINNNKNNSYSQQIQQRQRIRQLQYELRTCQIQREQLRTRVGILNQLLQEKFLQQNSFIKFINFNNRQRKDVIDNNNQNINQVRSKSLSNNNNNNNKIIDKRNYHNKSTTSSNQQSLIMNQQHRITKQQFQNNINLIVQLKKIQILNQQLINENNHLKKQLQFLTKKENNHFSSQQNHLLSKSVQVNKIQSYIKNQSIQQEENKTKQQLTQLKQKLLQYEQQKKQTQQTISILQQKQKRFEQIQRPKLLQQIKELIQKINQQKDTIDKLQMENNLINFIKQNGNLSIGQSPNRNKLSMLSLSNGKLLDVESPISGDCQLGNKRSDMQGDQSQQHKQQNEFKQHSLQLQQMSSINNNNKNMINKSHTNTNTITNKSHINNNEYQTQQNQIIISLKKDHQLIILKKQRDYFNTQYHSLKYLQQTNYKLQLKIEDLQNQLNSIKQLIEVDDQITF